MSLVNPLRNKGKRLAAPPVARLMIWFEILDPITGSVHEWPSPAAYAHVAAVVCRQSDEGVDIPWRKNVLKLGAP